MILRILVVATAVTLTTAITQPVSAGRAGDPSSGQAATLTVQAHPAGVRLSSSGTNVWELAYCGAAYVFIVFLEQRAHDCTAAAALAIRATIEATAQFPRDVMMRDAFRHCTWAAWLTIRFGDQKAREFTTRHEMGRGEHIYVMMDLYNNAVGHIVGQRVRASSGTDDQKEMYLLASDECRELAENEGLETLSDELEDRDFWLPPQSLPVIA